MPPKSHQILAKNLALFSWLGWTITDVAQSQDEQFEHYPIVWEGAPILSRLPKTDVVLRVFGIEPLQVLKPNSIVG